MDRRPGQIEAGVDRSRSIALGRLLDDYLDLYAVVGDDTQITTIGHRVKRICRH